MPSILDMIISESEEHRPFMGGNTSDVLARGPKKGTITSIAFTPDQAKVTITTQVKGEGTIYENYRLDKGGLNFLLGVAASAGVKTTGRKLKDILKELKGKVWYFDYVPPAEGEKYHRVSALTKADYDRKLAARQEATGDGEATWEDADPEPEPAKPAPRRAAPRSEFAPDPEPEDSTPPAEGGADEYDFL
jgi:hypothetical protein